MPRSYGVLAENSWKSVLLGSINPFNLNWLRLKRLIPIENDISLTPRGQWVKEFFFLQQSVLRKVNPQDALQIANPIMTALLQMLNAGTGVVGGVQEDALMAIGTLVEGQ